MKKKQIFIPLFIFVLLILATIVVILYGKGYRFGFENGRPDISGTGLLVATSSPDGAQVFINGHLTTATNNTINLAPKTYDVKIVKEGYFPWEKQIVVKKEIVAKAEALLLPTAPKLENITIAGANNPTIDPSQIRIAYTIASQSARKNGIYVLDMSSRPILTLSSASTQIADETVNAFSKAQLTWSPDGSELIASVSAGTSSTYYLLQARSFNQNPSDVTETLASVNAAWLKQKQDRDKAQTDALSAPLRKILAEDFNVIAWSPDETKILYTASKSALIPIVANPRMIGVNSTPEDRELKKGTIYVYDIKEDRNYKLLGSMENPELSLRWFPDSKHLIYVHEQKIDIMEYDGQNLTTVYAGPFLGTNVFPWSDGSRIVTLTNLGNPNITPNLYTIVLK